MTSRPARARFAPPFGATLALVFALAAAACAGVLGLRPRDPSHPFEHRAHSVRGVTCLECHQGITGAGDVGPLHLPTTERCVACHTKPHDTRACASCHGQRHLREEAVLARAQLRFSHAEHLKTEGGQCVACHAAAGARDQASLRPPMAQCFTCHVHRDAWSARSCDGCHVDLPAERVTPSSHVVHEGDFVREHGVRAASARELCATCHGEPFCAKCHGLTTAALPWRFELDRPRLAGLHRAGFRQRHADEARAAPGTCTSCHADTSGCTECHAASGVGAGARARSPHPPGWVRARGGAHGTAARLDPAGCASCHGGAGEALCVGCHRVGGPGGSPHGPGFSSGLDKLGDDPCRKCHAP